MSTTKDKTPENIIATRMKMRMAQTGKSMTDLSEGTSIHRGVLWNIMSGNTKAPRIDTMKRIAAFLETSVEWLSGETDEQPGGNQIAIKAKAPTASGQIYSIPVVGTVEAGAFRPVIEEIDETTVQRISISRHDKFKNFNHFAFDVRGDSMNLAGINEGDKLICVDWAEVGMMELSGLIVVVERVVNGGHLREWTVKQMEVFKDKILLHPRSTNQAHKPIEILRDHGADNGTEIRIIALVDQVIKNVFPF